MIYIMNELNSVNSDAQQTCSENSLLRLLPFLSDTRQEKVEAHRFIADKLSSAAAFSLLRYALSEEHNFSEMPIFCLSSLGKPYLQNKSDIFFNISHTKEKVACIVGTTEVGIDVQERFSFDQGIMHYICSKKERALFGKIEDKTRLLNRLWVLKEAYTKYTGTGMTADLQAIDFSDYAFEDTFRLNFSQKIPPCFLNIIEKETYYIATCTNQVEMPIRFVTIDNIEERLTAPLL